EAISKQQMLGLTLLLLSKEGNMAPTLPNLL
ncbi:hypothetical protein CISIN_1g0409362mg, partial [Citrus sinensis]